MYTINLALSIPVYEQIVQQTERFVLLGVLKPDDPLPSLRSLAMELSVNPNTVQKAYLELERRGITYSAPGKGVFIASDAKEKISVAKRKELDVIKEAAHECFLAGIDIETVIDAVKKGYCNDRERSSND